MMKFLFAITCLFVCVESSLAEDIYYNNEIIYKKRFNKLYNQFKDMFFSDGKKVYDLRTGCSNRFVTDANALLRLGRHNKGSIKGKIYKIINKDTFILKIGKSLVCVSGNVDTSEMEKNTEFDGFLASSGKYKYSVKKGKKKILRKFSRLTPVSKDIFKKFIRRKKLYTYKKIEKTVPAQTLLCPKCTGKGSYLRQLDKGVAGFRKCDVCNGKGTTVGKYKQQITWEAVEIE